MKKDPFAELLSAAQYALICLDAANQALGGWASEPYYLQCRTDLRKAIAKATKTLQTRTSLVRTGTSKKRKDAHAKRNTERTGSRNGR